MIDLFIKHNSISRTALLPTHIPTDMHKRMREYLRTLATTQIWRSVL